MKDYNGIEIYDPTGRGLDPDIINPAARAQAQATADMQSRINSQKTGPNLSSLPNYLTQDLFKNNPLPWQRYIDPSVNNLVNEQLSRVYGKSSNAFDPNNINPDGTYKVQPVDTVDNFKQSMMNGVETNPTGPKPTGNAMLDAINNKYASQYANKYSALGTQSGIDKSKWQSNQLANTGAILGNIQANEMANFKEQYAFQQQRQQLWNQWNNANEQAKGSFLSSILSIGLGAIATVATGGAAAPALLGAGAIAGVNAGMGR